MARMRSRMTKWAGILFARSSLYLDGCANILASHPTTRPNELPLERECDIARSTEISAHLKINGKQGNPIKGQFV